MARKAASQKPSNTQETPTSSAVSADVDLNITSEIDLEPEDWLRAHLDPPVPLERGEPRPFDKEACLAKLANFRLPSFSRSSRGRRWAQLKLPLALSREEAHFWLVATCCADRVASLSRLAKVLAKTDFNGRLSSTNLVELIEQTPGQISLETALALANLVTPEDYAELVLNEPLLRPEYSRSSHLLRGFQLYVRPCLTTEQTATIRQRVLRDWDPHQQPQVNGWMFPPAYALAAAMRMHDEVEQVVSDWPNNRFGSTWNIEYEWPIPIVLGLGTPEKIALHWQRLGLSTVNREDTLSLLAATGLRCIEQIAESILQRGSKEECDPILSGLAHVRAPEAAEPMLRFQLFSKSPAPAREWLDRNVGNATCGLIPTAAGEGKLAAAALEYLRNVKRRGFESTIAACLERCDHAEAVDLVARQVMAIEETTTVPLDEETTPEWLAGELAQTGPKKRPKKLPTWLDPALVPPLMVGERCLNAAQVAQVLQLLATAPLSERPSLFRALRQHMEKKSRDDFAWQMYTLWQASGAASKDKWAMGAIGHLGDDACVLRLSPLIRAWPGESQHRRAVYGLECLRAIGSDTALMQLSGMAQKLKFQALKQKARQFMDEIAAERGMSRDELEDRAVPDCGLDAQGRREFSFGPRSFYFVLAGDLKAMVKDEAGKVRANLPKPGVKDDAEVANASLAEWKLIKKQIKEVATVQARRLEQAMVTGRRWSVEVFERLMVHHPLTTHLIQKLIFAAFDTQGNRLTSFRVTEERDYADAEDHAISLEPAASVSVVHPLNLSEAERAAWGEVLSDYGLASPFPQLGRAIYQLEPGEADQDRLTRLDGLRLVAPTLIYTLEKFGWQREVMDGGRFDEHSKPFPDAGVTAVIEYDGHPGMGYVDPTQILSIRTVHFCAGLRTPSEYGWVADERLSLQKVPPIVLSEVLANLETLATKAVGQ